MRFPDPVIPKRALRALGASQPLEHGVSVEGRKLNNRVVLRVLP